MMSKSSASLDWMERAPDGETASPRLADMVVTRLSEAIIDGRLKPGDAIPSEGQIALSFGVSKPVAREALRELAALGVLHVQHGKATRIRELSGMVLSRFYRFAVGSSSEGLRQAVELRRILEPQLAGFAAARRTDEDCAAISAIIVEMDQARGDIERWIENDLAFHGAVAAATHNRLLILNMAGLKPVFREILDRFNSRADRAPHDWMQTYERHTRIADAILRGDAGAAVLAMTAHFEAADTAIEELFPDR